MQITEYTHTFCCTSPFHVHLLLSSSSVRADAKCPNAIIQTSPPVPIMFDEIFLKAT